MIAHYSQNLFTLFFNVFTQHNCITHHFLSPYVNSHALLFVFVALVNSPDHLMINAKQLSTSQWKRFHADVALFQTEQSNLMRDMIVDYGCHQDDDLHRLPHELQYALYRFSCVILK